MNNEQMNHTQNNPYMPSAGKARAQAPYTDAGKPMADMGRMPAAPYADIGRMPAAPMSAAYQPPTPLQPMTMEQQMLAQQMGQPAALPPQGAVAREGPPPLANAEYIPGFLARNIGRYVHAEFILGTNQFVDRTGRLVGVGVNYFLLQDLVSNALVMCDLYSVKFVTLM